MGLMDLSQRHAGMGKTFDSNVYLLRYLGSAPAVTAGSAPRALEGGDAEGVTSTFGRRARREGLERKEVAADGGNDTATAASKIRAVAVSAKKTWRKGCV